jgi:hypothetical protein
MTTSPVKAAVPANPKEGRPQMQMADANGRCKLAMQTGNANRQCKPAMQTASGGRGGVARHDFLSEMIFIQKNGVID